MTPEQLRRRGLRRMKLTAFSLLVAAAAVLALTYLGDGDGWVGFVRAGAEAAMVGGLADWFAVTALFRHPLGLPIPHTALIPRRKDAIGESLGEFVQDNFLSRAVVTERLREAAIVTRLGTWLAEPVNARRVGDEVAVVTGTVLRDSSAHEVLDVMTRAALERLQAVSYAPLAGELLAPIVADGRHVPFVDILVTSTRRWLVNHREVALHSMGRVAPGGIPKFLKDPVVERVYERACELAYEVERDPGHELRASVDELLADYARRLRSDPPTVEAFDRLTHEVLGHPATARAIHQVTTRSLEVLADLTGEADGPVRTALLERLVALGERMRDDPEFALRLQIALERLVGHVVETYGDEIARLISDTVARWDAAETTERIELQIGRDLQFIRINGTVVGALAGVAIHTVTSTF